MQSVNKHTKTNQRSLAFVSNLIETENRGADWVGGQPTVSGPHFTHVKHARDLDEGINTNAQINI